MDVAAVLAAHSFVYAVKCRKSAPSMYLDGFDYAASSRLSGGFGSRPVMRTPRTHRELRHARPQIMKQVWAALVVARITQLAKFPTPISVHARIGDDLEFASDPQASCACREVVRKIARHRRPVRNSPPECAAKSKLGQRGPVTETMTPHILDTSGEAVNRNECGSRCESRVRWQM